MTEITISGRTFKVEGPTPQYGTYLLTGPKGAVYITAQAYIGDEHTFKVLGGRYGLHELAIYGKVVRLSDASGTLEQVKR